MVYLLEVVEDGSEWAFALVVFGGQVSNVLALEKEIDGGEVATGLVVWL